MSEVVETEEGLTSEHGAPLLHTEQAPPFVFQDVQSALQLLSTQNFIDSGWELEADAHSSTSNAREAIESDKREQLNEMAFFPRSRKLQLNWPQWSSIAQCRWNF